MQSRISGYDGDWLDIFYLISADDQSLLLVNFIVGLQQAQQWQSDSKALDANGILKQFAPGMKANIESYLEVSGLSAARNSALKSLIVNLIDEFYWALNKSSL